jgi:hypothetical protein
MSSERQQTPFSFDTVEGDSSIVVPCVNRIGSPEICPDARIDRDSPQRACIAAAVSRREQARHWRPTLAERVQILSRGDVDSVDSQSAYVPVFVAATINRDHHQSGSFLRIASSKDEQALSIRCPQRISRPS